MARRAVLPVAEAEASADLAEAVSRFANDPLGFVLFVFPWGMEGTALAGEDGPDRWQARVLHEIGERLTAGADAQAAIRIAVASGHGIGKALAHGEPVLTPMGWVPIETLRVGDWVIAGDGTATRVMGVFPQGERDLFRVTLDDGTSVVVDGDHQWFTTTRGERKRGKPGRVRTTREIAESLIFPNGPRAGLNHELPVVGAVQHPTALLPVEPYLFGCWLGDGDAAGRITGEASQFECLVAAGADLGGEVRDRRRPHVITRAALGIRPGLRALGVYGCRAHEKRIPRVYLHADARQRTALLQGLLDTDGTVNDGNAVMFDTTSPGLADDVAELVRSLGGVVRRAERRGAYGGRECRRVYRLYLSLPRDVAPFRLPAKAARYRPRWGERNCDRTRRRFIASVEPAGRGQATCIAVEHPSHLFVTRDHIVTHNTALVAWLILWFIATRPHPQIVVTANTKNQLEGKTWRELAKWHKLAICESWFQWTATKFYHKSAPDTWFASAVPWTKERAEAFAGTHEKHVLLIFDEASAIADEIWDVAEGALTTAGAMQICFGNPTRNTGRFRECWRRFRHRWFTLQVDSRTAKKANQKQIEAWIEDYGEDSDFVRIRVKGEFPRASSLQFIDADTVEEAAQRYLRRLAEKRARAQERGAVVQRLDIERDVPNQRAPLIMAVDVARQGDDESVIGLRRGDLFLIHKRYREVDTVQLAGYVAEAIQSLRPDAVFIDGVGIGAGVVDQLRSMGFDVVEVNGGLRARDDRHYFNRRAEMWDLMRKWLKGGGMIEDDAALKDDLTSPEYGFDAKNRWQLETKDDMRARGLPSPDTADALSMTFFQEVAIRSDREASSLARKLASLGRPVGTTWMAH